MGTDQWLRGASPMATEAPRTTTVPISSWPGAPGRGQPARWLSHTPWIQRKREREREREGKRGRRRIEGHTAVCCPADGLSVLAPCCLTWWCMHLVERPTFSFPIYRFFLSPSFSLSLSLAVIIFIQIYAQRYRNDT